MFEEIPLLNELEVRLLSLLSFEQRLKQDSLLGFDEDSSFEGLTKSIAGVESLIDKPGKLLDNQIAEFYKQTEEEIRLQAGLPLLKE